MTPEHEVVFYSSLGAVIRRARQARGMTQRNLGHRVGVSAKAVCQWETARTRPDLYTLRRLEQALGEPLL